MRGNSLAPAPVRQSFQPFKLALSKILVQISPGQALSWAPLANHATAGSGLVLFPTRTRTGGPTRVLARVGPTIPPHLGLPAYGPPVPLAVRQAGAAAGRLLSFMYIFADRRGEAPFLHCRPLSERERRRPTQAALWVVALPRPHRSKRPTFRHCRGPGAGRSACRPERPRKRELQRPQGFELPSLFRLPPDDCIASSGP